MEPATKKIGIISGKGVCHNTEESSRASRLVLSYVGHSECGIFFTVCLHTGVHKEINHQMRFNVKCTLNAGTCHVQQ
jgi:hypothetical protein